METDEARGGSTPNIVRWVLAIGLLLAVIGMSLAWIIPALSRGGETKNVDVSREIVTENRGTGSDTDSIITPEQANPDQGSLSSADGGNRAGASTTGSDDAQPTVESKAPGQ